MRLLVISSLALMLSASTILNLGAQEGVQNQKPKVRNPPPTMEQIVGQLAPYTGPSEPGIDVLSLKGKILAGYQGWFNTATDGADQGWFHYQKGKVFAPGNCVIDMWPDVSELPPEERYPTDFRFSDGGTAEVFSSYNPGTVGRHFQWMKDYGIDGGVLQRFASRLRNPRLLARDNVVLRNVQAAANQHGRGWAVMYDLSSLPSEDYDVVINDWRTLVTRMQLGRDSGDKAYLKPGGKPMVVLWGVGFGKESRGDPMANLLAAERVIDFLKDDPVCGGNFVSLGVPYRWLDRQSDAMADADMHRVLAKADLISPWAVGRYRGDVKEQLLTDRRIIPDLAWCSQRGIDYMPVVFPGFSWQNLKGPDRPFNEIPRQKGEFLWKQGRAAVAGGVETIYVAMFDEVNEATAIFKCLDRPPVGESQFLTMEGLPSDHYLWLTGMLGKMLRGEIPADAPLPTRKP
jgi:hypothetical protein